MGSALITVRAMVTDPDVQGKCRSYCKTRVGGCIMGPYILNEANGTI